MLQTKEEVIELLIKPTAFQAWLLDKDPSTLVGTSGKASCCPVANFLMQSGIKALVHPYYISVFKSQTHSVFDYIFYKKGIGNWIELFTYNIDNTYPGDVTATSALEVLSNITEGVFCPR